MIIAPVSPFSPFFDLTDRIYSQIPGFGRKTAILIKNLSFWGFLLKC